MMVRSSSIDLQMLSFRSKKVKNRNIIFGLKSDNSSREILLKLLAAVVKPEDNVLVIHVQKEDDAFDPNTFHIHEDLCKSKKVDFQVKVCNGESYITVLTHQVRLSYASILALGSSLSGLNYSAVNYCLKGLPPTCTLLVMNNAGRIIIKSQGTSQQGGSKRAVLQSSFSSSCYNRVPQSVHNSRLQKSLTVPYSSTSSSIQQTNKPVLFGASKTAQVPNLMMKQKLSKRLALLESEGSSRHFTMEEIRWATNNFSPVVLIGEGGHSNVYRAVFEDGKAAAVKVLKTSYHAVEDLLREVDLLSSIKHENIVEVIGYCNSREMQAIVYNLLRGSLRQNLRHLKWRERMRVAIGVAKALDYLHHSCNPPVVHRDVKSSNILLSDSFQPQLSDFGAAMLLHQSQQASENAKPFTVVGTFGYLAPEYMMYGEVDEKIDVYSYGVVLLELITGKEAVKTDQAIHESLVLWARSLLSYGLFKRLIDPYLNGDYNKEEMEIMMIASRLCLVHSSSKRPTIKTILRLFEEPDYWIKMQRVRDEFLKGTTSIGETEPLRQDESVNSEDVLIDNL
ncbi:protein kinase STUNTED [Ziziphus jujuba]|uniref:Protein kinase STUNTED n=1 Tax=Ziziphus jujuba TaxID=326968 RepID=A0A6P4AVL8_ZIZJJ|nr:protein kinase STUNTED [Ziziphus jujuba]